LFEIEVETDFRPRFAVGAFELINVRVKGQCANAARWQREHIIAGQAGVWREENNQETQQGEDENASKSWFVGCDSHILFVVVPLGTPTVDYYNNVKLAQPFHAVIQQESWSVLSKHCSVLHVAGAV
jgi:hypothetical protein